MIEVYDYGAGNIAVPSVDVLAGYDSEFNVYVIKVRYAHEDVYVNTALKIGADAARYEKCKSSVVALIGILQSRLVRGKLSDVGISRLLDDVSLIVCGILN